ncbi:MAG: NYN domain-containing protein [Actinomycetota bacterium]|nr:NYN domain-containing protein [Actinomycetota bacterium]
MPDADLYLFDGYNLLYAGPFDDPRELVDSLASFVALRGARGVVVFDGVGEDAERGPLQVRYAPHADTLLERLAADHRGRRQVLLVTSDTTVAAAAGGEVTKLSSQGFFRDLEPAARREDAPRGLEGKLDPETRARLERLRRGE